MKNIDASDPYGQKGWKGGEPDAWVARDRLGDVLGIYDEPPNKGHFWWKRRPGTGSYLIKYSSKLNKLFEFLTWEDEPVPIFFSRQPPEGK